MNWNKIEERLVNFLSGIGVEYKDCVGTYEEVSKDDSHDHPVINEKMPVIYFDDVSGNHCEKYKYEEKLPSNDALFIDEDKNLYFIEFKNGKIKRKELRDKSTASLIVAIHLGIVASLQDAKQNVRYILVSPNANLARLYEHVSHEPWGVLKPQRWLYKSTKGYSPEQFRKEFLKKHYPGYNP